MQLLFHILSLKTFMFKAMELKNDYMRQETLNVLLSKP